MQRRALGPAPVPNAGPGGSVTISDGHVNRIVTVFRPTDWLGPARESSLKALGRRPQGRSMTARPRPFGALTRSIWLLAVAALGSALAGRALQAQQPTGDVGTLTGVVLDQTS